MTGLLLVLASAAVTVSAPLTTYRVANLIETTASDNGSSTALNIPLASVSCFPTLGKKLTGIETTQQRVCNFLYSEKSFPADLSTKWEVCQAALQQGPDGWRLAANNSEPLGWRRPVWAQKADVFCVEDQVFVK